MNTAGVKCWIDLFKVRIAVLITFTGVAAAVLAAPAWPAAGTLGLLVLIVYKDEYRSAGVPMLPVVQGDKRTAWWILAHTIALVAVSLAPLLLGARDSGYAATAGGLGLYYLWRNIQLVREPVPRLARHAFKASLVYLTGLLIVMLADLRV